MKPTEHDTKKTPVAATGFFAVLGGLLPAKGSGARAALLVPVLALVCLAFSTATAQAEIVHEFLKSFPEIPSVGPHREAVAQPGVLSGGPMAFDSGHLWVSEGSRIDEFDASTGAFLAQPIYAESSTAFSGERGGHSIGGIAVGHEMGSAEGQVYVGAGQIHDGTNDGTSALAVFSEAGTLQATWTGTPSGPFGVVSGVAVDNSTSPLDWAKGDVYVAAFHGVNNKDEPVEPVVDVFHPEAGGKETYVTQLTNTGASPTEPFPKDPATEPPLKEPFRWPDGLAVDESNGDLLVGDVQADTVDVFEPTALGEYALVRKNPGDGNAVAVDSGTGEVYAEEGGGTGEYSSTGAFLGRIGATGSVAVDPESHDVYIANGGVDAFGPDLTIPDVTVGPAPSFHFEPATRTWAATLKGIVNPLEAGEATCEFEYGTTKAYGTPVPCTSSVPEGDAPEPVKSVPVTGLQFDTTYYYRLSASNEAGGKRHTNMGECPEDCGQFTTSGPRVEGESVSEITATSAKLNGAIDPHGAPTTDYFQYGKTAAYEEGDVPAAPGVSIGSGTEDAEVIPQNIYGLSPATVYHYRVVARSEVEVGSGEFTELDGPDQTFTTQGAGTSSTLPDGRAYEQVSPPDKHGADFYRLEAGDGGPVQASADGGALAALVSLPSELEPQGYANQTSVLLTRQAGGGGGGAGNQSPTGWSSHVIAPPHAQPVGPEPGGEGAEVHLYSADLSHAIVQPRGMTLLSSGASEQTAYLRDDALSNQECTFTSGCYLPFVARANDTAEPFRPFGEASEGYCEVGNGHTETVTCGPLFLDGTPDLSHVILSSSVQLTSTPAPKGGLYEWSAGEPAAEQLQLVSVPPAGEAVELELAGTRQQSGLVDRALSADGSRVVLESQSGNGLYLRDTNPLGSGDPAAQTTVKIGEGQFETASADDSHVFFTTGGQRVSGDLYEYDLNAPEGSRLTDITVAPHAGEAANMWEVLGASEDGSYVYFLAAGALTPEAEPGSCHVGAGDAPLGTCNLYVRHDGVTTLITPGVELARAGHARVSPNGEWLAFMSSGDLTGYDTDDAHSGQPDQEVYLYHAGSGGAGSLTCASCNPTGARPVGIHAGEGGEATDPAGLGQSFTWVAAGVPGAEEVEGEKPLPPYLYQPRYLSNSGRSFFDSNDALVPLDVNGTWDVYEYEPEGVPSGPHACAAASTSGSDVFEPARSFWAQGRSGAAGAGCVALISSGTSPEESSFLDASETGGEGPQGEQLEEGGGDVFFLTNAQLSPTDTDTAPDVYDAHECTTASPCLPPAASEPPPCTTEASCKAAPTPQPSIYGAPASATFSGPGDVTPEVAPPPKKVTTKTVKCKHGFVKKKVKKREACVKTKSKKSKKAKKATNNRRAER